MPTILVIDDDRVTQLFLQKALCAQGYDVEVAGSGLEGLEKAALCHPDLIICDWLMPQMDGMEVCRRIKADPSFASAFFVLLTNRSDVDDCVVALDGGADEFLAKPIEVVELQARVRAGLRLQRINQDLQAQKRLIESELAEAADYMRSLLPPPMQEGLTIDSRFIPSRQLGGDCFDYYWLDPDYLAIYLMDVSGHGLGAALLSISVQNLLRSQSLDGVNFYQPSHVLTALNETFQMDNQQDKYFTIWYGVYNRIRHQLVYSSAGHPPAVLITQTDDPEPIKIHKLKTKSLPIGMMSDTRFRTQRCEVSPTSTLYIFSDGLYEIPQADGTVWGIDAFIQKLTQDSPAIAQTGLDHVMSYVQSLNVGDGFDDDVSLLRVQF